MQDLTLMVRVTLMVRDPHGAICRERGGQKLTLRRVGWGSQGGPWEPEKPVKLLF